MNTDLVLPAGHALNPLTSEIVDLTDQRATAQARATVDDLFMSLKAFAGELDDALIAQADAYIAQHPNHAYTFHDGPYTIEVTPRDSDPPTDIPARYAAALRDELHRNYKLDPVAVDEAFAVSYTVRKTALAKLIAQVPVLAPLRRKYAQPRRRTAKVTRHAIDTTAE